VKRELNPEICELFVVIQNLKMSCLLTYSTTKDTKKKKNCKLHYLFSVNNLKVKISNENEVRRLVTVNILILFFFFLRSKNIMGNRLTCLISENEINKWQSSNSVQTAFCSIDHSVFTICSHGGRDKGTLWGSLLQAH
jgi:hypothetical protein